MILLVKGYILIGYNACDLSWRLRWNVTETCSVVVNVNVCKVLVTIAKAEIFAIITLFVAGVDVSHAVDCH